MSKLKVLMYRDFIISFKGKFLLLFGTVNFMIFYWLVALSIKIGNLKEAFSAIEIYNAEDVTMFSLVMNMIFYVSVVGIAYFTSQVTYTTIISDVNTNWRTFAFTLPCSSTDKALVLMINRITAIIKSFLLSVLNCIVLSSILELKPNIGFAFKLWAVVVLLNTFADFLTFPFILKARDKKEVNAATFIRILILIVLFMSVIFFVKLPNDKIVYLNMKGVKLDIPQNLEIPPESWIMPVENPIFANCAAFFDVMGVLAIPLIIALLICGLFVNKRMAERRYD